MADILRKVSLKDGSNVTLGYLGREDLDLSHDFFCRLPEKERYYLRRDVTRRTIIDERIREIEDSLATGIVALSEGKIVGDAMLFHPHHGWYRKTGEVRLIIDSHYRGKGLRAILAREIFSHAIRKNINKLEACFMETQKNARRIFENLGFTQEGVLRNFVVDINNQTHDLLLLGMTL